MALAAWPASVWASVISAAVHRRVLSKTSPINTPTIASWTSSGTAFPVGTSLIKDIFAGPDYGDYYPSDRAVLNGYAYFNGDDGSGGGNEELWATNGTALGTTMIKDIRNPGQSEPHEFVDGNDAGSLVFAGNSPPAQRPLRPVNVATVPIGPSHPAIL